jgi:hypothetical protein
LVGALADPATLERFAMADDYRAALDLLRAGADIAIIHHKTSVPIEALCGLADALDGEAAGTMPRFGSVIDPRYRPRDRAITDVHWAAGRA